MQNNELKDIFICLFVVLLFGCAQQVPPMGGPKDDQPPKVIGSKPKNKTTQFDLKKITIQFDEYIQLRDQKQIIISPPIFEKPIISNNQKNIEILLTKSKLKENTTYTIQFGNAISDIHEGTNAKSFSYLFSTGDFIDSNFITGDVTIAENTKREKDITVALFNIPNFNDTAIVAKYPDYFSKTAEDGSYTISNLPQKSFFIFAFKDLNSNGYYDKNEPCAYNPKKIDPGLEMRKNSLFLFSPPAYKPGTITDYFSKQNGKFQFAIYEPTSIKIEALDSNIFFAGTQHGNHEIDTLNFFSITKLDTVTRYFKISKKDTNYILGIRPKLKSKSIPLKLVFENPVLFNDTLQIKSNLPTLMPDTSRISIKCDTLSINVEKVYKKDSLTIHIIFKKEPGKSYSISIQDSAFTSIYGDRNSSLNSNFSIKSEKDLGSIILNIQNPLQESIIYQLTDETTGVIIIRSGKLKMKDNLLLFNNLTPKDYRLKFIIDENNNGKWDSGNLAQQIQPEKVYYEPSIFQVKAYWDIEQTVDLKNIINN